MSRKNSSSEIPQFTFDEHHHGPRIDSTRTHQAAFAAQHAFVHLFIDALIVKYGSWIFGLSAADRMRIVKGIPSRQTPLAVWEVVRESLLHRRIFKVNPLLGYMHMSLAFGWFLLIVVGWIETVAYLGFRYVPLHGHVFFKYFATEPCAANRRAHV